MTRVHHAAVILLVDRPGPGHTEALRQRWLGCRLILQPFRVHWTTHTSDDVEVKLEIRVAQLYDGGVGGCIMGLLR